jgi:hypothetical protein
VSLTCHRAAMDTLAGIRHAMESNGGYEVDAATVQVIHLLLANAYRDERGCVDETIGQVRDVVGSSYGQTRRALAALDRLGLWIVERKGNQHRGTVRRPAFISSVHLDARSNGVARTSTRTEHTEQGTSTRTEHTEPLVQRTATRTEQGNQHVRSIVRLGVKQRTPGRATPRTPMYPRPSVISRGTHERDAPAGWEGGDNQPSTNGSTPDWLTDTTPLNTLSEDVARLPHATQLAWAMRHAVERIEQHRANTIGPAHHPAQAHAAVIRSVDQHRAQAHAWINDGCRPYDAALAIAARVNDGNTVARPPTPANRGTQPEDTP